MIKLIVAVGPNNLIGIKDKMPWHIKEEFQHFKETTLNSWLLMGKRTFEGLSGKLVNRKMCIATFDGVAEGADRIVANEKEILQFLNEFKNSKEVVWIAGGKSIYEAFYKEADELIISEVKTDKQGDVFLNIDLTNYKKEKIKEEKEFTVYKYTREKHGN